MRYTGTILALSLLVGGVGLADAAKPATGTPPGLAKKGGVPPGLAKKFGTMVPAHAYIAIDPQRDDRAWFLVGDRWVLHENFTPELRTEVRYLRTLSPLPDPPPIPLPRMRSPLVVLHFG